MKVDKIELDTINTYISGIDKFISIAKIQENEGKKMGALDAMLQAQEQLFDLKDYIKRNID